MAQEVPQPPNEALTKRVQIVEDVPASLEVAGHLVLFFDKQLKSHLVAPLHDPVLCLYLSQIVTNSLIGTVASRLRQMKGAPERNGSGLWLPPGV